MIKKNGGYYVYGTVSAGWGNCDKYTTYNNALFFMDWIKKNIVIHEQKLCNKKLWVERSSKRWIARMENGCEQGRSSSANHIGVNIYSTNFKDTL